jgi:uncharacterized membrane protein YdjX (TVP38/TMEM64 family)
MKKLLIKIIFLLAVAGLIMYLDLTGLNQKINLEYYKNILSGPGYARLFIYTGICIVAPNLMFPFAAIIIAGSIIFGCVKGMIFSLIGGFLSAIAGYYLARFLGRDTIRAFFLRGRLADVDKKLSDNGFLSMLIIRTIGMPFGIQNYIGGITGINLSSYASGSLIGMLPWVIGLTLLGESFVSIDKDAFFIGTFFLISFYILGYFLTKKFSKKFGKFEK